MPPAEVHLWSCRTDIGGEELSGRLAVLSASERDRAARFRDRASAVAFIAAHGWLRCVLEGYAGAPARDLAFEVSDFGKPRLAAGPGFDELSFNLSHSGDLVVVAVAGGMPVGVDIERIRPMPSDFPAECLASGEAAALAALTPECRDTAFMRCWTRKEAYLKALGTGLNTPLDSFEVSLAPHEPARLISVRGTPEATERWRLEHLDPAPGYCGALAAPRRDWSCIWMAQAGAAPEHPADRKDGGRVP